MTDFKSRKRGHAPGAKWEKVRRLRAGGLWWAVLAGVVGLAGVVSIYPRSEPDGAEAGAHQGAHGEATSPLAVFAQAMSHLQSFGGNPPSPEPWRPTGWDVAANNSDSYRGDGRSIDPMDADHGADCGAPPAAHRISTLSETVFICRDHLMTAMSAGYGAIYLTPNALVDFSGGEAVIKWDMSTQRGSGRDWVDLWITPYEDNLVLPLEDWLPAYQGEPRRAVHVRLDGSSGGTIFKGEVIRDHEVIGLPGADWRGYEHVLTPDAARRDAFELRISRTRIKFGMPSHNLWWLDTSFADLGWSRGVVQFGHHAYNPTKDCGDTRGCYNTWHWDNASISSVSPLTIIRGNEAVVNAAAPRVSFPSAAPQGSSLRFAAVGANLEVSFDDGRTWQAARRQAQEKDKVEHWSSYWTPLPAGTTAVRFRGQSTWAGAWMAQHVSAWSSDTAPPAPPAPSASPTATHTPSPTAVPSTPTPTPPTASPSPSPSPTATKVPAPASGTVTFDDRAGQDQPLSGQYPSNLIDWGTNKWFHSAPWGKFATKSVSFNGGALKSASFRFVAPRKLVSVQAYNGGATSSKVSLSCAGQKTKTVTLAAGQLSTISTGWTGACSTVTVASSNGWETNFDTFVTSN